MALKKCKECGNEVSSKAESCPTCGAVLKKKTSGCVGCLAVVLFVCFVLPVINSMTNTDSRSSTNERSGQPGKPTKPESQPIDEAQIFISKYGRPDSEDSTEHDVPQPLIVLRWLTYEPEHLRALFTLANDKWEGRFYKWKLVGFTDPRPSKPPEGFLPPYYRPLDPEEVAQRMEKLMERHRKYGSAR